MSNPPWFSVEAQQLRLDVKVKPSSKQNALSLDTTGCLQISLQASAQEGKANKMLVQYLAKLLRLPQKQITILRGTTSRLKTLSIQIVGAEQERVLETIFSNLNP